MLSGDNQEPLVWWLAPSRVLCNVDTVLILMIFLKCPRASNLKRGCNCLHHKPWFPVRKVKSMHACDKPQRCSIANPVPQPESPARLPGTRPASQPHSLGPGAADEGHRYSGVCWYL